MREIFTPFSKISLLLLSVILAFNACTEDKYYGMDWDVFPVTVKASDWQWDEGKGYALYFADVKTPELTVEKAKDGGIQVARVIGDNVFKPLPYTEYLYDDIIGYYSETVDFEYEPGYIRFYVKQSDLYDNTPADVIPLTMTFKITIFY